MSNPHSGALRHVQHEKRLAWLRAYPALWSLPSASDDVEPEQSIALDEVLKQMKFYRLYPPGAGYEAARYSIRVIVSEIRGQPVIGTKAEKASRGDPRRI